MSNLFIDQAQAGYLQYLYDVIKSKNNLPAESTWCVSCVCIFWGESNVCSVVCSVGQWEKAAEVTH